MSHLLATVLGDVALVILVSWVFGGLARRLGQPAVIGQILAGIALGPTLLGRLPGDLSARLFPAEARPFLSVLAQIAVVLFLFVAGHEIDFRTFRAGRTAVSVAVAALLTPMALAVGAVELCGGLFSAVDPGHAGHHSFALFMAVALSVTALPVLAAIVRERGAAGTPAGTVAITAAGLMDVAAWLVLAAVLSDSGQDTRWPWPVALALLAAFVAFVLGLVRPVLRRWLNRPATLLSNPVPVALVLALGSAWVTESLGLHAVFGGFLAGLAMPRRDGAPNADVLRPMEQTSGMLLPLFFVSTGLSVDIGTLGADGLGLLGVLLVAAIAGKVVPAYGAARVHGLDTRQSALVAVMVNTRGLTELIVLDVGRSAGLIGQDLYAVLVLMALVTTFMTGPLLQLLGRASDVSGTKASVRA
ncbi:cation:proton antiporter [Streptomyces diastatochromogenes]|uniref:Sodium:proton antiporter n=1 Tax=Streptomyces diastatochromogenes TaxID=42236 RepID=A0A233S7T3_STRDA|nr:cation:proton antiporter [Streptomyces diastatochromogenes]OXY91720.1 sodium:proton antiporter [Streptomyces diastatochromogenes]